MFTVNYENCYQTLRKGIIRVHNTNPTTISSRHAEKAVLLFAIFGRLINMLPAKPVEKEASGGGYYGSLS